MHKSPLCFGLSEEQHHMHTNLEHLNPVNSWPIGLPWDCVTGAEIVRKKICVRLQEGRFSIVRKLSTTKNSVI